MVDRMVLARIRLSSMRISFGFLSSVSAERPALFHKTKTDCASPNVKTISVKTG